MTSSVAVWSNGRRDVELLAAVLLHLGAIMDAIRNVAELDVAGDIAAVGVRERGHERLCAVTSELICCSNSELA